MPSPTSGKCAALEGLRPAPLTPLLLSTISPAGQVMRPLDYSQLPSQGQITSGSTWNFQYWFRDPLGGGFGFDLSDGLTVVFDL